MNFAGGISYRHKFIDMTSISVEASNFTRAGKTCPAAMGFSFAAGTTDGDTSFALLLLVARCYHSDVSNVIQELHLREALLFTLRLGH